MFKVTRIGNNRLNIEFDGKLDSKDMEVALDDFISKASGIENGKMLYEIGNFEIPSLAAVAVKISKLPSLFGLIGKFDKAAILTDKRWLQKVSELEGLLIPGLQIKAYNFDEKSVAEKWLSEE